MNPPDYSQTISSGPEMGYENQRPEYTTDEEKQPEKQTDAPQDVFGDEENAEVKYKVLNWWYVI